MPVFTVGPNSTYPSITAAMAAAGPGDTIRLEPGYSNEIATVQHEGMTVTGAASSVGIELSLATGIATVTLAGEAPINLADAADGNAIVGNDGANLITVTAGADSVSGGLGEDRLFVDYRLATGAVTGDTSSNVAEAGGGGRLVTINGGFEDFIIWTGTGADTITTGDGDDYIFTGNGAGTVTAGEGANSVVTGDGADTITGGSGGNYVVTGDGANTVTTGAGLDRILTGNDADTIVSGSGQDRITAVGGADSVDAGAGWDTLVVDYAAATTNVTGGVTNGDGLSGHGGHIADLAVATLDFVGVESFLVTTGSGADSILTGDNQDSISTAAGADRLDGGAGSDLLTGGSGNDTYIVDNAGDQLVELAGGGDDDVAMASVSYRLAYGVNDLVLTGIATRGIGNSLANEITGNAVANSLQGLDGNDRLVGGGGADKLYGGDGDDSLQGAGGADAYYFDTRLDASTNVDRIVDFSVADDTVFLDQTYFKGIAAGTLNASAFRTGTSAGDSSDRIIHDAATGRLFYDPDGSGGAAQTLFATVSTGLALTSADFIAVI